MSRYCPECRAEYRDEIERCGTCQVALVEALSEKENKPSYRGELVKAVSFNDADYRREIFECLRAKGIVVEEKDEEASGGAREWADLNLHLYLWESDVAAAREVLDMTEWKQDKSFYHLPHTPVRSAEALQTAGSKVSILDEKFFWGICILALALAVTYFINQF